MKGRIVRAICVASSLAVAACSYGQNVVTDWVAIVQPAVNTPPKAPVYTAVIQAVIYIAMYDATAAISGQHRPFAADLPAAPGANINAAVATAAWKAARARVDASQVPYLDAQYERYLSAIQDGPSKTEGVRIGEAAAAAILELRANDGFNNVVQYECSSNPPPPGEFEPDLGCEAQPVGVNAGQIRPFTFEDPNRFLPDGPTPVSSGAYLEDFVETRDYGRADSTVRTAEQTDIAYFWQATEINKAHINLVISRGLNIRDSARYMALVYTASADANIAGFAAKYHYRFWRPRTAIPRADMDDNPDTDADPTWKPLISVNHPEYPSAHSYNSTAQTDMIAKFFGTNKVRWTLTANKNQIPQLVKTERTYTDMNAVMREIYSARVWAGLHWRHSMLHGAQIGRKVAKHIFDNYFRPK